MLQKLEDNFVTDILKTFKIACCYHHRAGCRSLFDDGDASEMLLQREMMCDGIFNDIFCDYLYIAIFKTFTTKIVNRRQLTKWYNVETTRNEADKEIGKVFLK